MAVLMGGSLVLIAASAGILVVGWLGANPSMIVASMVGLTAAGLLLLVAYARSRRIAARVVGAPEGAAAPIASAGVRLEPARTPPEGGAEEAEREVPPVATQGSDPEVAPLPVPGAASVTAPIEDVPGPEPTPARAKTTGKRSRTSRSTRTGAAKAERATTPAKAAARSGKPSTKKAATATASAKANPKRRTTKSSAGGTAAKRSAKNAAAKQPPKVIVFDGRDKYHRPSCRFAKGRGAEEVTKATARRWGYEPCSICDP